MKNCCSITLILLACISVAFAQNWNSLGPGLNGEVYVIEPYSTDGVYVGGAFTDAGGNPDADYLARWDGQQWHAVLPGLDNAVHAIILDHDLKMLRFIGGEFTKPYAWVMKWHDAEGWTSYNNALNGPVRVMKQNNLGLFAAGDFDGNISTLVIDSIQHAWMPIGGGLNGRVNDLETYGLNDDILIAGGAFTNAGGLPSADKVALWDGSTWLSIGPPPHITEVLDLLSNGSNVYISGTWAGDCHEPDPDPITRWDGTAYNDVGLVGVGWLGGCRDIGQMTILNDRFYACAYDFVSAEETVFTYNLNMERWDGIFTSFWYDGTVHLKTMINDGRNIYIGGIFTDHEISDGNFILRWGDVSTGTTEEINQSNSDYSVYPNPATDVITIRSFDSKSSSYTMTLINGRGQTIWSHALRQSELDITGLPAGLYVLKVEQHGSSGIVKFVKY